MYSLPFKKTISHCVFVYMSFYPFRKKTHRAYHHHTFTLHIIFKVFNRKKKWILLQNFVILFHQTIARNIKTEQHTHTQISGKSVWLWVKMIACITLKLVLNKSLEWTFLMVLASLLWMRWRQKGHQHFRILLLRLCAVFVIATTTIHHNMGY